MKADLIGQALRYIKRETNFFQYHDQPQYLMDKGSYRLSPPPLRERSTYLRWINTLISQCNHYFLTLLTVECRGGGVID